MTATAEKIARILERQGRTAKEAKRDAERWERENIGVAAPKPTTASERPADWDTLSPGKKAAWTRKHGKPASEPIRRRRTVRTHTATNARPADWSTWSPGRKAAFTRKANKAKQTA